ncbi:Formin binding protein, putative [Penicillium digitatum]|uniref:Formin binding protein, putative n=3 Tax=Penicillium digitatum TaxID=36651 RepID=K9FE03_PEND2|nr:Formin binding protein, putative [Penicillium digitatum Pd1]EKV07379.1 Formin binding protein, putative [Penicillium digitatum PHI26]EKV14592.1 Formin binding protein, putative [Penicillium digitatum Pd1]QQK45948.1 Formin binding protein, putative [Penicillium digitatum]
MAEFWKSAPRYWCKQCKIFIRDTPFEKTQHEASPKHQGSLKRFLRQIHNDNEQKQRDSQRAKTEVERLRQAVGGESSTDKDSAKVKASPVPKLTERPASLEERKKQMAQLVAMGVAVPQEFRAEMALAGDWETTSETRIEVKQGLEGPTKSVGIRKRKLEGEEEGDEHAPEPIINKGWGSRMRQYPGAPEEEGLDDLFASTKDIKKTKIFTPKVELDEQETVTVQPTPTAETEDIPAKLEAQETKESIEVKIEEPTQSSTDPVIEAKPQGEDAAPGVIFKKRKPKAMRK